MPSPPPVPLPPTLPFVGPGMPMPTFRSIAKASRNALPPTSAAGVRVAARPSRPGLGVASRDPAVLARVGSGDCAAPALLPSKALPPPLPRPLLFPASLLAPASRISWTKDLALLMHSGGPDRFAKHGSEGGASLALPSSLIFAPLCSCSLLMVCPPWPTTRPTRCRGMSIFSLLCCPWPFGEPPGLPPSVQLLLPDWPAWLVQPPPVESVLAAVQPTQSLPEASSQLLAELSPQLCLAFCRQVLSFC
mmetsp:Transcript_17225/g.54377  ORF Transcript_17225/g.54377 Transcript_17225/m.54377 type:complete len:248 (-) Transcript_17225:96-839(-)